MSDRDLEKRYFKNHYPAYDETKHLLDQQEKLDGEIVSSIHSFIKTQTSKLVNGVTSNDYCIKDFSVYTGEPGIALYLSMLSNSQGMADDSHTKIIRRFLRSSLNHCRQKKLSFLCGDSGCLALSTVLLMNSDPDVSKQSLFQLLSLSDLLSNDNIPDELLYGKAGYLFALLFVYQSYKHLIPSQLIQKVVNHLFEDGIGNISSTHVLCLSYTWHNKHYVGAAHGYIGILYILLQVKLLLPSCISSEQLKTIALCLDQLLELRFTSGNICSSIGNTTDKLVHWCHGAPGAVHLYALAYKIYADNKYLNAAHRFAEVIWSRGLLCKGYGLCHGVAGNGYAFLCMFQLTNDSSYLWKAVKFAEWCLDYGVHGCRTPDHPFSLFEGLAGTLYFLLDILTPYQAKFPAFQLLSYK
ncbi:glutathione S-transferase LANCL1 isoform X1 [Hydra vulgaris]|nr:glutathione S-transferase LANCL1 isoform X1 [Hydra vulgaris]